MTALLCDTKQLDFIGVLGIPPIEVVGLSGGAKYRILGISSLEMTNTFHWLGALVTILNANGIKETTVQDAIHPTTNSVLTPITRVSMVITGQSRSKGMR